MSPILNPMSSFIMALLSVISTAAHINRSVLHKPIVSGIPLVLGLRSGASDPDVYVVFGAPKLGPLRSAFLQPGLLNLVWDVESNPHYPRPTSETRLTDT